jgi:hypothetical protein
MGAENLTPTGIRSPDRPARSESLYRLASKEERFVKQPIAINMSRKAKVTLDHGSRTRGPPACVMPPPATFLHGAYPIKITQYCRQFGTSLADVFACATCELAYSNGTGPLL